MTPTETANSQNIRLSKVFLLYFKPKEFSRKHILYKRVRNLRTSMLGRSLTVEVDLEHVYQNMVIEENPALSWIISHYSFNWLNLKPWASQWKNYSIFQLEMSAEFICKWWICTCILPQSLSKVVGTHVVLGPVYMIQAGRDAYRDPARNTNSKECLYDPAMHLSHLDGIAATDAGIPPKRDEKFPYKHFIPPSRNLRSGLSINK
jgi:hypothetical protein